MPEIAGEEGPHHSGDQDCLRELEYRCLLCGSPPFGFFILRPGTLEIAKNLFDVGCYGKARPGYVGVDYLRLENIVCPVCFFASPLQIHFARIAKIEKKSEALDAMVMRAVEKNREERCALGAKSDGSFWQRERTDKDVVLSYELAIRSFGIVYEENKRFFAGYGYQRGVLKLKLAQFYQSLNMLDKEADAVEQAKRLFMDVYPFIEGESSYRMYFQMMAIALFQKDKNMVMKSKSAADMELQKIRKDPKINGESFQKWYNRIVDLFDRRDMYGVV